MTTNKDLRDEFSRLHNEADRLVTKAASVEGLTADEQSRKAQLFIRMDELKAQQDAATRSAALAFANGEVHQDEPKAKAAFDFAQGNFNAKRRGDTVGLRPSDSFARAINAPAESPISLGAFCRGAVLGARDERERFALQQGNDSTGRYEVPITITANLIDQARMESAFIRGGSTTVPLDSDRNKVLRLSDILEPTWREPSASVKADDTFAGVAFAPRTLAVICKAAREDLQDAVLLNEMLTMHFARGFGAEFDKEIAATIATTSGVHSVDANGSQLDDYSYLLDAMQLLNEKNFNPNAVILAPRDMRTLNGLTDSTFQPLRKPQVLETVPFIASANLQTDEAHPYGNDGSSIYMGDFPHLVIGIRASLSIEILRERFADTLSYGFLAHLRASAIVAQPKAMAIVSEISG